MGFAGLGRRQRRLARLSKPCAGCCGRMTDASPGPGCSVTLFDQFRRDPHAIVRWTARASPRDFGSLRRSSSSMRASSDPAAIELMRLAAGHIDALAARLIALGAPARAGRWLGAVIWSHGFRPTPGTHLLPPAGDALDGALQLARAQPKRLRLSACRKSGYRSASGTTTMLGAEHPEWRAELQEAPDAVRSPGAASRAAHWRS